MKMKTSSWNKPADTEEYEPNISLLRAGLAGLIVATSLHAVGLFLITRVLSDEGVIAASLGWQSSFVVAAVYVVARAFDRVFFKGDQ